MGTEKPAERFRTSGHYALVHSVITPGLTFINDSLVCVRDRQRPGTSSRV